MYITFIILSRAVCTRFKTVVVRTFVQRRIKYFCKSFYYMFSPASMFKYGENKGVSSNR